MVCVVGRKYCCPRPPRTAEQQAADAAKLAKEEKDFSKND